MRYFWRVAKYNVKVLAVFLKDWRYKDNECEKGVYFIIVIVQSAISSVSECCLLTTQSNMLHSYCEYLGRT